MESYAHHGYKHYTSYKWIVSDFDNLRSEIHAPQFLESEKFSMIDEPKTEWRLVMKSIVNKGTPNCHYCNLRAPRWISLYLENCKADEEPISLNVYFSILDAKNDKVISRKFQISDLIIVNTDRYGFESFFPELEICEFLVNQNLQIHCQIEKIVDVKLENLPLIVGLELFINNETFSDVVFFVGEKKIHAHKLIITSHSRVFQAMFANGMEESNSNEARIPDDIEFEVFYELLRFMYTGNVEKLDELGLEIFKAAHYYQIDNLQLICECTLQNSLNIENAVNILKLCDESFAECLKAHSIAFILKNFKAIMKTAAFKDLHKTHPHLPFELLLEIGEHSLK